MQNNSIESIGDNDDSQGQIHNLRWYTLSPAFALTFDDFYAQLNEHQELKNITTVATEELNFDSFLAVTIKDNIVFKLVTKDKQTNHCREEKILLQNNLAAGLMDTILQRLKLKKKNFSYKNLVEQSFSKHAKNNPDLLVSDIYGPNSSAINLPPNMLAASLGKLSKTNPQDYDPIEITRSFLIAFTVNSAQLMGLVALKHKIANILILENSFECLIINRFIFTLLGFYNPQAKVFFKDSANI